MPWGRSDDQSPFNPKVMAVGNAAYGASCRARDWSNAHRRNGWISAEAAHAIATPAEIRKLTTVTGGGRAPMWHKPGDPWADCTCLQDKTWPEEDGAPAGYWVHDFLDYNPSRQENDVHRAKRRELKDKNLRAAVKARDGDQCRYCAVTVKWADRVSGRGGVLDHVDPDRAEGAKNLVVACRSCNSKKKNCTPEGADMVLLPPPGERGRTHDQPTPDLGPDQAPDLGRDAGPDPAPEPGDPPPGPAPGHARDQAPTRADVYPVATTPTNRTTTVRVTGGTGGDGAGSRSAGRPPVGDAGPDGVRRSVGPPRDVHRDALHPNPYLRNQTAPDPAHDAGDTPPPPAEPRPSPGRRST